MYKSVAEYALFRLLKKDSATALFQQLPRCCIEYPATLASNPKAMTGALGIVYRAISTHLTHKAGFAKPMAQTGAVTLIQRFGSALNLNIHFHMLFLDGVYIDAKHGNKLFWRNLQCLRW